MDNHFHAIIRAPDPEMLGHFMRTTNSRLARAINRRLGREYQAIRERYKAPHIKDFHYFKECMQYIFGNRLRARQDIKPDEDPHCSAFWYLHKPYKKIDDPKTEEEITENLLANLLDEISELGHIHRADTAVFIRSMATLAIERALQLFAKFFEHGHTIGDKIAKKARIELLNAYRKSRPPPKYA